MTSSMQPFHWNSGFQMNAVDAKRLTSKASCLVGLLLVVFVIALKLREKLTNEIKLGKICNLNLVCVNLIRRPLLRSVTEKALIRSVQ